MLEPQLPRDIRNYVCSSKPIKLVDGKNVEYWAIRSQAPKFVIARIRNRNISWGRFNDWTRIGVRSLANFNDRLRYSLSRFERFGEVVPGRGAILLKGISYMAE
jgi:hypothetical protein